jgi:hypothetical protein
LSPSSNLLQYLSNGAKRNFKVTLRGLSRRANRRLSTELLPTFADRGCYVVSVTDLYGRILGFLYLNFKVREIILGMVDVKTTASVV